MLGRLQLFEFEDLSNGRGARRIPFCSVLSGWKEGGGDSRIRIREFESLDDGFGTGHQHTVHVQFSE